MTSQSRHTLCKLVLISLSLIMPTTAVAQETWQNPPEPIAAMLDTPQIPAVSISPNNHWLVEFQRPALPPIDNLVEPIVRIAGIEINPLIHGPAREYAYYGIAIRRLGESVASPVSLPPDARIRNIRWSQDSQRLAFTLTRTDGLELWILELETGQAKQLTGPILNATYGNPCDWLPGEAGLLCKVIPDDLGSPPVAAEVPTGPLVEQNLGRQAPTRTYTNLLQTPHDEALFEHYLTSNLEHVALDGTRTPLVESALIDEATPSPDGQWILLESFHRPFSYQVPASRFPVRLDVLNLQGKVIYEVADLPLADDIPITFDSVRRGRRRVNWRADQPASLYWVEALDEGDARKEGPFRDALYTLAAPFQDEPHLLWKTQLRYRGIAWGNSELALGYEYWYATRQVRVWQFNPSQPEVEPVLLEARNFQDAYNDPGEPVTGPGPFNKRVLWLSADGKSIYLNGPGASPAGVYPFLDRLNLETNEKTRLWQAEDPFYETVERVLDPNAEKFITRRQSQVTPPNYQLVKQDGAEITALTEFKDPLAWYADVSKELVRYQRADGVELSATLYLPPGYDPAQADPLPTLLWVYPEEHKSRETAGQITTSENTFSRPRYSSVLFLLTQGYAVLSGPTMPIIGEADEEPNDTYVEQLIASAQAAVDYLVERGITNPDQVAIGGHSYGAFTTANLLAHSDLFRAGIARSGAYNRTLTPFGFQGEQRTFWEAPDTYIRISPFANAAQINEPLLLIHGADDNNPGTYPIQSERLYEAMKGLGGTVRWVSLPHEGHGYRSREASGHVLWEMVRWLDQYVKDAPPRSSTISQSNSSTKAK